MRKRRIVGIAFVTLCAGSGLVSAFSIPGVTRPFDPAAYYSETQISYRDSTYTPFTMKDLARNGYRVKDVTRDKKNILSEIQTYTNLLYAKQSVDNKKVDLSPLPSEQLQRLLNFLFADAAQTARIQEAPEILDLTAQDVFQTTQTVNDPTKTFTRSEQLGWLEQLNRQILQSSKQQVEDDVQMQAILVAADASNQAKGTLAAMQSNNQMQSIYAAAVERRNALIANYIAQQTANQISETANALQSAQNQRNGLAFIVSDPYRPTEQEKKQYTRPDGLGFVNFK